MMASPCTTFDVLAGIRLDGRTYLVTGGTSGLGYETARSLAAAGARVIITTRDRGRGEDAAVGIRRDSPDADIAWVPVDLASLNSVRRLAGDVAALTNRLDGLVANAGIMGGPFRRSDDGHELQFAVNHLSHHVIAVRLAPLLVAAAPARVVVVSSAGHAMGELNLDDLGF